MLNYFEEEMGLSKDQWLEVYYNVFENEFIREKVKLNHHLRCCNINNFGSRFRLQPV